MRFFRGHFELSIGVTMQKFASIEKLDTAILYTLELAYSLSVLLLAFGLFAGQVFIGQQVSLVTILSFWPLVLACLLASGRPKKEPNASARSPLLAVAWTSDYAVCVYPSMQV